MEDDNTAGAEQTPENSVTPFVLTTLRASDNGTESTLPQVSSLDESNVEFSQEPCQFAHSSLTHSNDEQSCTINTR